MKLTIFYSWRDRRWGTGGNWADEKSSGHFGREGKGTLARPTFFEAINAEDRQTERAGIDEKKGERGGKKSRNPRRKNALAAERKYTRVSTRDVWKRAFSKRSFTERGERFFRRETRPIETRSKLRWIKIGEILRLSRMSYRRKGSSKLFLSRKPSELILSINLIYLFIFIHKYFESLRVSFFLRKSRKCKIDSNSFLKEKRIGFHLDKYRETKESEAESSGTNQGGREGHRTVNALFDAVSFSWSLFETGAADRPSDSLPRRLLL